MPRRYAQETLVSTDKSRTDIEKLLDAHGATKFMYGKEAGRASIVFEMAGRRVRIVLPLPDKANPEFGKTVQGRTRTAPAAAELYERAQRQAWRALWLIVRAKLEAIAANITTFDEEFLAFIVLPDNQTVGDRMIPQIGLALEGRDLPALMGAPVKRG